MSFGLFSDAALTTPVATPLPFVQDVSAPAAQDMVVYLGNVDAGSLQALSDPGVDSIIVSVVDDSPSSGLPTTDIFLAATAAGLDTAIAGAPLDLGPTVSGGVGNKAEIHIRVLDTTGTLGVHTDLRVVSNDLIAT